MSKKLFSKASIVVALMGMGLFIANPIKADSKTPWWQPNVEGMCGDNTTGWYTCKNQNLPHAPEASQESEGRQEENETPEASREDGGRQEENETPEASQEDEGRQEESDNQQEDIFTPIVEAIIEAVLGAWTQVLNWFNS
ncbi:TPA: hypothetical protein VNJ63_000085 [Streptococcus pyogenes]|uniref:hypothetical protein n=1 Tax=Streptococcus pyogenes TaxID=1314 RepID=UPI0007C20D8D|nr:hypothetical protein [Streptococcus pyogenes]AXI58523.1 hypothetical protein C7K40_07610 [Streptococcus pyogenes]OAC51690.1 hypothetical protein AWT86_00685 [Streptococcus pyogenes]OAC58809.1 hypothetical protein AWU11_00690 [Streptococcus pyogenes]OAC76891.1 hypothetical protein AWT98_05905 [Streptococcus pyogenes]SUO75239.1 Uncharacterised protein [Streptococcus pyogenes]